MPTGATLKEVLSHKKLRHFNIKRINVKETKLTMYIHRKYMQIYPYPYQQPCSWPRCTPDTRASCDSFSNFSHIPTIQSVHIFLYILYCMVLCVHVKRKLAI